MTSEQAVAAVIDALEAENVPYMVVGSLATNYYGIPRATQDADFVVQLEKTSLPAIAGRLGPAFSLDPQKSFELVTGTIRHVLDVVAGAFRIDLFELSGDEHDQARFARRRRVRISGRQTFVPTVEDLIVTKLRWSRHGMRTKDAEDVRNMIAVQQERIDWDYVHGWCDRQGTREILEEIRRSIPPVLMADS